MKFSLKIKLMIAFFVFITIPVGVLGYISYNMSSTSIQNSVQEQLKEDTENVSKLVNQNIELVKSSVEIASFNNQLINAVKDRNSENINLAYDYIKNIEEQNKDFMEVLIITDNTGKVIMDTENKESDIDLSDRDYFKEAISTGKEVVSDVLTSKFTGNPAIFIIYPLKENGQIIGTLVGSIKFESISKYAAEVKSGESGYAYIINKDGLIVYHPDSSKILKNSVDESAGEDLKALTKQMKEGQSGDGFYTYNNIYKYVVFKPVGNWEIAVTANYNEYMASALEIKNYTIIISIISIIITMICAYLYSVKGIINPITKLEKLMSAAGDGDLTVRVNIKGRDEIQDLGESFNEMIKHQGNIVKSVEEAAEQLSAASQEMAASSEEISASTEEISASINNVSEDAQKQNKFIVDISTVLVQLSSLVQLAQNRAKATSLNAEETMKAADNGREKVEETVKAMNIISKGSNETSQALQNLNSLSTKVDNITNMINSIAEETNLLALNAAIEAARAGEHGKGFSVVAEEVRKLSEESNARAKEISNLVSDMIKLIKEAVSSMEKAKHEVDTGVKVVSETDKAFIDIIHAIKDIANHINEILDITGDEVASSDKVVSLINDIATITESNSENSKNVSLAAKDQSSGINNLTATAEETSAMAEELTKLVERFKL